MFFSRSAEFVWLLLQSTRYQRSSFSMSDTEAVPVFQSGSDQPRRAANFRLVIFSGMERFGSNFRFDAY